MLKILVLVYALAIGINGTTIIGSVKDNDTKEKIADVQIIFNKTDTIYTNAEGNFEYFLKDSIELESIELNYSEYETRKYIFMEEDLTEDEQKALKKEQRKKEREERKNKKED
jgi:hypothetical protein